MAASLDGRRVLITGGARGIGADTARRLVAQGARVVLVDIDRAEVERTAASIGPDVLGLGADVVDRAAVDAVTERAVAHLGGLDVVVANAGISGTPVPVLELDPAEFRRVIDINLHGVFNTVHAALPYVVEQRGYVLAIASIAALVPGPLLAPYVASKHAVDGFARSLRMELAHTGTRVGVGYFSFIDTPMVQQASSTPRGKAALNLLPAPFNRPIPVDRAGRAMERGIRKRSAKVYAPRWVPGLLAARGMSGPGAALLARDPRLTRVLKSADSVS